MPNVIQNLVFLARHPSEIEDGKLINTDQFTLFDLRGFSRSQKCQVLNNVRYT